jgi:hypothetical protein
MQNHWIYNDGGREEAGYKGDAGDCGVRSVAIAFNLPYQEAYDMMKQQNIDFIASHNCKEAKQIRKRGVTPRNGFYRKPFHKLMESLGAKWVATMQIGSGCKIHLKSDELPRGRIICNVSKHYAAVIDGVINDTYDCSRNGTRCVYGYWIVS